MLDAWHCPDALRKAYSFTRNSKYIDSKIFRYRKHRSGNPRTVGPEKRLSSRPNRLPDVRVEPPIAGALSHDRSRPHDTCELTLSIPQRHVSNNRRSATNIV